MSITLGKDSNSKPLSDWPAPQNPYHCQLEGIC
jgi:hypothetical protein